MNVGKRIRNIRESKGMEQLELAEKINVSQSKMNKIETGFQKRLEPDILVDLSKTLDVSVDYLLGRTDNPNANLNKSDFDPMAEINNLLRKYDIDQSGFFDIDKWKAMGPDEIRELESYFEFITSRAKERNKEDKDNG